jgi:hypothetical protein
VNGRVAVAAASAVAVLAAGGITTAVLAGSGAGAHPTLSTQHSTVPAQSPSPTLPAAGSTPTPTPAPTLAAVHGAIKDAKPGLSYPHLGSPWANGCPRQLSSGQTLTWTAGESAVAGHVAVIGRNRDWLAEACSGLLPGQYGYKGIPSLNSVTRKVATTFVGAYYPGVNHTFTVTASNALPVSGRHGWEVKYLLNYPDAATMGLPFTSEEGAVVVIDRGSALAPAVFFASVPGNLDRHEVDVLASALKLTMPPSTTPSNGGTGGTSSGGSTGGTSSGGSTSTGGGTSSGGGTSTGGTSTGGGGTSTGSGGSSAPPTLPAGGGGGSSPPPTIPP